MADKLTSTDMDSSDRILFKKIYPELDLLRSIAILLVLLVHFARRVYMPPAESWLAHLASWGWNGVGLFFVLSGFLIGGQIIEETQRGTFSFKKFYIRRFFRIFPPYYFSLLVVSVLFFAGMADTNVVGRSTDTEKLLTDLAYHIFYLQDYLSLHRLQSGLYWSLAIEEQFYILIPFVLFFLLRYQMGSLPKVMAALILIAILIRIAHYTGLLPYIPDTSSWNLGIRFTLHTRFDSLLSGVLTAWCFIRYHDQLLRIRASKEAAPDRVGLDDQFYRSFRNLFPFRHPALKHCLPHYRRPIDEVPRQDQLADGRHRARLIKIEKY
jgi:peptidoglycan/LPS O-acetylase OafA/YrhL